MTELASQDAAGARHLALVRLLADGRCHSGEAIARHLGISRAAVWKALHRAVGHYGLALESVRGRGYRLFAPLELLDAARIRASLSPAGHARLAHLDLQDQIDSTNAYLMRAAGGGAPSGTACLAERQTAGRGRRGRVWVSPFGANLYLSLLWRFSLAPSALGGASLAVGAAVADLLHGAGVSGLALKWPNDLLWQGRKLAGLLLEVAGESQGPSYLVVGVGINLLMPAPQGTLIDQPWIDLAQALDGRAVGRNELAARLLDALLAVLDRYEREGLAPFLDQWRRFDAFQGRAVRLLLGDPSVATASASTDSTQDRRFGTSRVIEGIHAGIASDGSLQLETSDGLKRFQAGEVSLRL